MSLTTDDLRAITHIVNTAVDTAITKRVPPIVQRIVDEAVDNLAQQTAAGFAEVHERIDRLQDDMTVVKAKIIGIEAEQRAIVAHIDEHGVRLDRLEKHTGLSPA